MIVPLKDLVIKTNDKKVFLIYKLLKIYIEYCVI